jgi:hypothetical protein
LIKIREKGGRVFISTESQPTELEEEESDPPPVDKPVTKDGITTPCTFHYIAPHLSLHLI